VKKIQSKLSVQNSLAQDALIAGVFEKIDNDFKETIKTGKLTPKPLMICSGGTSSRCTANGHWTLDLRRNYQQIDFDNSNLTVEIGAGISMKSLLEELSKYNRTFPTGLSNIPGVGYILTGGISPLSRSQGLAIDQILEIKGVWGNGKCFKITKPVNTSSVSDHLTWRGLCGAAPFLGIVTNLTLRTYPLKPIIVWQATIKKEQLADAIIQAENGPNAYSLQWIWGQQLKLYGVISGELDNINPAVIRLKKSLPFDSLFEASTVLGLRDIPPFSLDFPNQTDQGKLHCEVVSLLGPNWGSACNHLVQSIEYLISIRPNKNCFIAAQQLGGASGEVSKSLTSFIHRRAIWKPWINASWEAGNPKEKERSLNWLEEAWRALESNCPGVHLAQMHQHLHWHTKETKKAFEDWLPGLHNLKSKYDPQGILPRL